MRGRENYAARNNWVCSQLKGLAAQLAHGMGDWQIHLSCRHLLRESEMEFNHQLMNPFEAQIPYTFHMVTQTRAVV